MLLIAIVPLICTWTAAAALPEELGSLDDADECMSNADDCAFQALQRRAHKLELKMLPQDEDCYRNSTYYVEPTGERSMPNAKPTVEANFQKCQEKCAAFSGCHYFTFYLNGSCLLTSRRSSAMALRSTAVEVTSGPGSCSTLRAQPLGPMKLKAPLDLPPWNIHKTSSCSGRHKKYSLEWEASGDTFFDDWQFLTESQTHGSEWYLNKTEAFRLGLVRPSKEGSIIKVGDVTHFFKRHSVMLHSARAWRPEHGFLLAMKYKHLPNGLGLWPSFWTVNSDYMWPNGGELDILEYANDEVAKVSFHTDQNCTLDVAKMNKCMSSGQQTSPAEETNCLTDYQKNAPGCIPKQIKRNGEWWSKNPGVVAAAWDDSRIAVYHFPESDIPADLQNDAPEPDTWQKWLIAYLPFDPETCPTIAKPQEIVLTIALCGDASGGPWRLINRSKTEGWEPEFCWPGHINEPATDCCTKYMTDPSLDEKIKTSAYFDIDYVKVFEPEGSQLYDYAAGTYRNGGKATPYPCIPCGKSEFMTGPASISGECCPGCGAGEYFYDDNAKGGTKICPSKAAYQKKIQEVTQSMLNGSVNAEDVKEKGRKA